jgi:DNA-binding NarL/FixJ family response regulator
VRRSRSGPTLERIPLEEPAAREAVVPGHRDSVCTSLTAREREVLSHLVAGRAYEEIAKALFISEKTVSVHVSNLLPKAVTVAVGLAETSLRVGRMSPSSRVEARAT